VNVTAVRAGLEYVLTGLGFHPYAEVPGDRQLPAAVVKPPTEIRYSQTIAGGCELDVTVTLYVSAGDPVDGQRRLDRALSTKIDGSVIDALHEAANLRILLDEDGTPILDEDGTPIPEDAGYRVWHELSDFLAGNFRDVAAGEATQIAADVTFTVHAS
jgi:hypothetical protein